MEIEEIYKRDKCIYGVSEKFGFGKWTGYVVKFGSLENARKWLTTEEYDFRNRELISEEEAEEILENENYALVEEEYII